MSAQTSSEDTHTREALALLPLPRMLHLLTAEQLRGAECVWCCETLGAAAAFDFGTRTAAIGGVVDSQWFPRACRACVGRQARKAYSEHPRMCEQCVDDPTLCDEQHALRRLAMEVRR